MLTEKQIDELASGKGVRRIAVENFLATVEVNRNAVEAIQNLRYDAGCYRWNDATCKAIRKGIELNFAPK